MLINIHIDSKCFYFTNLNSKKKKGFPHTPFQKRKKYKMESLTIDNTFIDYLKRFK